MNALKYFGLISGIALTVATQPVKAQVAKPAAENSRTIPPGHITRHIRVSNLSPSIIAWYLQPDKQAEPLIFRKSRENTERYRQQQPGGLNFTRAKPDGSIKSLTETLPGLTSIVPLDAQNALLVTGDEAAINGLETIVTYLDKPLRHIEIEAQIVEVGATDMRAFGIDFTTVPLPLTIAPAKTVASTRAVGFVRGNFQATLNALVQQKRAKIVSAPRVTAINNLTATVSTANEISADITRSPDGRFSIGALKPQSTSSPASPASPLILLDGFDLTVTPTINNDETVTVVVQGGRVLRLQERGSNDFISLQEPAALQTVANVRDGGTVVLGGLLSQSILGDATQATAAKTVTLVFVTARIIRRLDETKTNVAEKAAP